MGMMARMRSLAPWFIIAVGGLFVLFMVLSDSKLADIVSTRSNNVGSINGQDISYQEYSNLVEQYRADQLKRTGQEIPENQMEMFRDQVWENMVSQKLITEKIKELGIVVTNDEIISAIRGPNPPEIITQYFIDSTGRFNREAYDQAILDPQNKEAMLQTEELVRQQLMQQKLSSFLNASVIVSDAEVKKAFVEQNVQVSADYVQIDINSIPDSSVSYSDEDLKNYYGEHSEDYKTNEQRKIKYVLFSTSPTVDDSAAIKKNLTAIVEKLKGDTSSFKTYVEIYSDKPYSLDTTSLSQFSSTAGDLISKAKNGDIVGPVLSNEGYVVYKLRDIIKSKESLVRASHILIKSGDDEAAAKNKIDAIYDELMKGADFESVAKEKSEDGSASKGGDLGWFGKGQMVKEFEDASFNGPMGRIQRPIKTQFGYHIIKVTGKTSNNFAVEKIVNEIKASATTIDRAYNRANDFSFIAGKNGFESEAQLLEYEVKETVSFSEEARVIPGIGSNSALLKFIFENGLDDISDAFKVAAGYVVIKVSEINKAGIRPFDDVIETVKRNVVREKKLEKSYQIANEIKTKAAQSGNLSDATSIFGKAKVSAANNFKISGAISGIGRDLSFAQAALDAKLNEITGPVKSSKGAYLLKVTNRTAIDSTLYSIQKNSLRDNILSQKRNRVFADWVTELKADAEVVDNRHQFYR